MKSNMEIWKYRNKERKKRLITLLLYYFIILLPSVCFAAINFKDESPTTEWQHRTIIDCYITVVSTTPDNIDIDSLEYAVSNSGPLGGFWKDDAVLVSSNVCEAVFSAGIPNSEDDEFKEESDNYIRWRCNGNDGSFEMRSFKINIYQNEFPKIDILQPKNNGYATPQPVIAAKAYDEGIGVDVDSIKIEIDEFNGNNIITVKGDENPGIFDSSTDIISYNYDGSSLNSGKYKLTISLKDSGYDEPKEAAESVVFTVKDEMIADLINYPNPFDPEQCETTIRYVLEKEAEVTINIYDVSSGLVRTVIKGKKRSKGLNEDKWDGSNFAKKTLSNGIYFCEFIAKDEDGEYKAYQTIAILGD